MTNPDDNYVFWADLASAHNAKNIIALLDSESINFVLKKDDPAYCPDIRLLGFFERFSLQGKVQSQKYSKNNWKNQVLFKKSHPIGSIAVCELD